MTLLKISLSILLLISSNILSYAQDAVSEKYVEIVQQFDERVPISYQARYHYYTDLSATSPEHELTLQIYKTKESIYYAYEQQEELRTQNQMITIDHQHQTIYVHFPTEVSQPTNYLSDYTQWIQLLELEGTQTQQPNGQMLFTFSNSNNTNTAMEIYYDPTTSLFSNATIAFDFSDKAHFFPEYDQTKWTMEFSEYELEDVRIPIAMDQIYQQKGDQLIGVGKYKSYVVERI